MKTLIRNLDTGLLYCSPGRWVESWIEAADFGDFEEAWKVGESLAETNLEVFCVDDDGQPRWGRRIDRG